MFEALVLGILQGLTEFLPVSSSGHLVLVQSLLKGFEEPGLAFDIVLHAGTLLAVLIYFRTDLIAIVAGSFTGPESERKDARKMLTALVIATVPAGIAGVLAQDYVENLFRAPSAAAVFLMGTGVILCAGEMAGKRNPRKSSLLNPFRWIAFISVGFAQALALLPGISRSGSTMAAGMAVGWSRTDAARFSFLLMIPAVAGAVILKIPDVVSMMNSSAVSPGALAVGFVSSAVAGLLAIGTLMKFVKQRTFYPFAIYCIVMGLLTMTLLNVQG